MRWAYTRRGLYPGGLHPEGGGGGKQADKEELEPIHGSTVVISILGSHVFFFFFHPNFSVHDSGICEDL